MILQCKNAKLYKYSKNAETKISSYDEVGIDIMCSLQPTTTNDGLEGGTMFNTYKLYSDYTDLNVGDKILVLGRTFIIKEIQQWNGIRRKYAKVLVNESIGN